MKKWMNYTWLMVLIVGLISGAYMYSMQTDYGNLDALGVDNNLLTETTPDRPVMFSIPQQDKDSKNYREQGQLKKPGQFTYSKLGQRVELRQVVNSKAVVKNGSVKYHFKTLKLLVNSSKTMEAQQNARNKFNDQDLGRQFMTVQVKYDIENMAPYDIYTDGVVAVSFMNGTAVTALSGLQNDDRLKAGISANSKVSTWVTVLVPASQRDQLQTMNVEFASVYDANGKLVTPKTDSQKISF